jgi:hypothetical protein
MGDGQLGGGIGKWMDGADEITEVREVCAFSRPGRRKRPHPTSPQPPPLRDRGILEPIHKGNAFPANSRFRWYNEIKVLCG